MRSSSLSPCTGDVVVSTVGVVVSTVRVVVSTVRVVVSTVRVVDIVVVSGDWSGSYQLHRILTTNASKLEQKIWCKNENTKSYKLLFL